MELKTGTRLGPYEILSSIGSGGMGEVYRARDARLGRDVAVKVLPAAVAADRDRVERFEREAKSVAALSHPNILAIHDFGSDQGRAYTVTELLEGETLRERLKDGPLPVLKAVAYGIQIANGLAAAHDKGIVHRDLKPENVMVLPDERLKILDFGLAKQVTGAPGGAALDAATMDGGTEAGVILGTVGYMSPEQVRGLAADARSDIFALGVLIYEMASGRRAFRADSPADTMSAILREEPPDLTRLVSQVPSALDRILKRCLEKRPESRFRSAHDLAIALEAISAADHVASGAHAGTAGPTQRRFKRVTFRNGTISGARFADDGRTILYGAAWEGKPFELYSSRPDSPESRHMGLPPGDLLAVSSMGELAVSLGHRHTSWFEASGTLARASLAGGGVRLLAESVTQADWSPDGKSLALALSVRGRCRIEYPAGTPLYETVEWVNHPRVSRDGARVAFADHPTAGDNSGRVCVVDRAGHRSVLTGQMTSVTGVCWSPDGSEVWFSGIDERLECGIWAIAPGGERREVLPSPARIRLHDVAPNGRVLLALENVRLGAIVGKHDAPGEAELSWFDGSVSVDLSRDGTQLLFMEVAEAENPHYAVYLRNVDGSSAVRLGEGSARGLSPDGSQALAILGAEKGSIAVYPTGLGVSRTMRLPGIDRYAWVGWHPDGRRIFVVGSAEGRERRLYLASSDGSDPRLLYDEEIDFDWIVGLPVSPDGKRVVLRNQEGIPAVWNTETTAFEPLAGAERGDLPLRFDATGRFLFVARTADQPRRIDRLSVETGERRVWREIRPPDPSGIVYVGGIATTPDGGSYAYTYLRVMSDLFVVDGIG